MCIADAHLMDNESGIGLLLVPLKASKVWQVQLVISLCISACMPTFPVVSMSADLLLELLVNGI